MTRLPRLATVLAVVVAFLSVPVAGEAADSTPVSFPSSPKGLKAPVTLPATLDAVPRYQPQTMCNPVEQPGITKLKALVLKTYGVGGAGNTVRGCTEGVSEHADGRAWDWMVNVKNSSQKKAAADFLAWVTKNDGENARRLGIQYVIYNKKIWGAYRAKDGWRASSGHTDHVHVSMSWNGARGNVSFWTGTTHPLDVGPCTRFTGTPAEVTDVPRASCPAAVAPLKTTSRPQRIYGNKNSSHVKAAQKVLKLSQSGSFDKTTRTAVMKFQAAHDVPVTGVLDQPTYAAMFPTSITKDALKGVTAPDAATRGQASGRSLTASSTGLDVGLLQTALGLPVIDRNGFYGARTTAAVKQLQEANGLAVTGDVGRAEWNVLAQIAG